MSVPTYVVISLEHNSYPSSPYFSSARAYLLPAYQVSNSYAKARVSIRSNANFSPLDTCLTRLHDVTTFRVKAFNHTSHPVIDIFHDRDLRARKAHAFEIEGSIDTCT